MCPRLVSRGEADQMLTSSGRLTGADGLAIYQRSYLLRIASCMREQFPALCYALGETLFNDFVVDYIRERPPESHTLYDLGRRFPAYLEETRPDRAAAPQERQNWADFMIDLAQFERQLFVMFDAPGHEGKPFADLATPDCRLRLQPCFALGAYRFAVPVYYQAVRLKHATPVPVGQETFVALVRTDYVTRIIPLREPHHLFLKVMNDGGSVEDGIGAVARHMRMPHDDVRRSWQAQDGSRRRWIDAGLFIASGRDRQPENRHPGATQSADLGQVGSFREGRTRRPSRPDDRAPLATGAIPAERPLARSELQDTGTHRRSES
jgi:hypothetical protein